MTTRLFNGSTLTYNNAAIARLVGMQYKAGGNVIDVTEPADIHKLFEVGQDDLEITAKVKRIPTLARGGAGTLAIVWADGSNTALGNTNWTVTAVNGGGDQDSPLAGDLTFKPTV
jgi:hypothetical protein